MFPSQSYDGGFGQGAGRESHGESDHAEADHAEAAGRVGETPAIIRAFRVEQMKVADGTNWFKGLTTVTMSSLIPPLLRLNLIILTQKPPPPPPHTHTLNILPINKKSEVNNFLTTLMHR